MEATREKTAIRLYTGDYCPFCWRVKNELERLGLDYEVLDSGCCGLAGSFGFEAGEKYDVSIAAGERVLLPKVREVDEGTLVITDGFSCQTQIEHNTDRRALHLAEVIKLAMDEGPAGPSWGRPEDRVREAENAMSNSRRDGHRALRVAAVAVVAAAGLTAWWRTRSR